tara:strand:- start:570 stop:1535 length:966 start_codon:yes stop_codon:yes gene_type:complete
MSNENKNLKFIDLLKGNSSTNSDIYSAQDYFNIGITPKKIPTGTGLMHTRISRTPFSYNAPAGASVMENQGAYIVMGQVPTLTKATGYGAKGVPADTIDLVVGRHSSTYGGKGPKKDSVVENNFATDAARIYISKLCDIDQAFGLDSPAVQNEGRGLIGRSGIGIKADGVRIVGREGIKITTGKMKDAKFGLTGETNSLSGRISEPAPRIDIIAGNNYRNAQGVGLGKKTAECLEELHDIIGQMWGSIFFLALSQAGYNFVNNIDFRRPWLPNVGGWIVQQQLSRVIGPLWHTRINAEFWKQNYLSPSATDYIVSRNVYVN